MQKKLLLTSTESLIVIVLLNDFTQIFELKIEHVQSEDKYVCDKRKNS